MKPPSLLSSFGFVGTPRELPPIPKAPVFLETSPASLSDPRNAPEKSRKVEAINLRLGSKVERGIDKLTKFLTLLEDGEFRTHKVSKDFNSIRPNTYDCEEERDKLDELIHLEDQQGLHSLKISEYSMR